MSRSTFDMLPRSGGRRRSASHSPTGSHGHRPVPYSEPQIERRSLMTWLTDLSLAGVILVVPFILGGRTPLGELVLVVLAISAAICWSLSQLVSSMPQVRWSGVEILFVAAIGLGVLQLIPLDQQTLGKISPEIAELLPLRTISAGEGIEAPVSSLPIWSQLSLYPAATRQGLILLGAYGLIFFVTLQRIGRGEDVERLLLLIAMSAVLMAVLGLAQYFLGNGKFFWFYEHPQTSTLDFVKGAFSNRNHFAQFLALGVGPLLWLVLRLFDTTGKLRSGNSSSDAFSLLMAVGLGMVMFAALLSLSRGGAVALFAATSVTLLLSLRAGILNVRVVLALTAAAVFLGAGLFFYGQDKVGEKIDELLSGDLKKLDHEDGRIDLWKTVWAAGNQFPVVGAGIGSHRELYPAFQHVPAQHDFTHAENGYLQIYEETGSIGLGMMLFGILCCFVWTLRGSNPQVSGFTGCASAVAGALAGNALHSCGDFVWYAPGIMGVVVILAACACRLAQLSRQSVPASGLIPRVVFAGLLIAVVAGGAWSTPQLFARVRAEPHWSAYQKLAVVRPGEAEFDPDRKVRNPVPQIFALRKLIKENPEDARAHARLARLYLIHFQIVQQKSENQMDVEQIRDAVRNSGFSSVEKMNEWIDTAFGRPRKLLDLALYHCRESLNQSPLLGDNYLFYSKLRFLEHPETEDLSPYWDQAVILRPMDGHVLFSVGYEYALMSRNEKAYEYWERAFRTGPAQQRKLIDALASHLGARDFIEKFELDINSSYWLAKTYEEKKEEENYLMALEHYGKTSEAFAAKSDDGQAAQAWLGAFNVFKELKNEPEAERCLTQAMEANRYDYEVRFAAGQWALLHQDFTVAEEHLGWCARRRPENQQLQSMVQQISHKTLDSRLVDPLPTEAGSDSTSNFDPSSDTDSSF